MIEKVLTFMFGKPEDIRHGDEEYLYRWIVAKTRWGNCYIHKFVGSDWSRDLHDHPKHFISIGLKGAYKEETFTNNANRIYMEDNKIYYPGLRRIQSRNFTAPWFRSFPATHLHRIQLVTPIVWTLVFVGKPTREWGFIHNEEWIEWRTYIKKFKDGELK